MRRAVPVAFTALWLLLMMFVGGIASGALPVYQAPPAGIASPAAHGSTHASNGSDPIAAGTNAVRGTLLLGAAGGAYAYNDVSAFIRGLLDDVDAATARATLGGGTDGSAVFTAANLKRGEWVSLGTFNVAASSPPQALTDAMFSGQTWDGSVSTPTVGLLATTYGAVTNETGTTGSGAGLGAAAAADRPYPVGSYAGSYGDLNLACRLRKADGDGVLLADLIPLAGVADLDAPVYMFLSRRTDLAADAKVRGWPYYRANATGFWTSVTPTATLSAVTLVCPRVTTEAALTVTGTFGAPSAGNVAAELGANAVQLSNLTQAAAQGDFIARNTAGAGNWEDVSAANALTRIGAPSTSDVRFSDCVTTLTDGATISTWDTSVCRKAKVTLTGNGHTLPNPTNLTTGGWYQIEVLENATGGWTLIVGNVFASAIAINATASAATSIPLFYDGSALRQNADPTVAQAHTLVNADGPTYTVAASDYAIYVAGSSAITLALPPAASWPNREIPISRFVGAGLPTIDPNGAELINGAATFAVTSGGTKIRSNGSAWNIIGNIPDADLDAYLAIAPGTSQMLFWNSSSVLTATTLTAAATQVLDDSSFGAMLATLGQGTNALPMAAMVNAGAQNDFMCRKTAAAGSWEDCTQAQAATALGTSTATASRIPIADANGLLNSWTNKENTIVIYDSVANTTLGAVASATTEINGTVAARFQFVLNGYTQAALEYFNNGAGSAGTSLGVMLAPATLTNKGAVSCGTFQYFDGSAAGDLGTHEPYVDLDGTAPTLTWSDWMTISSAPAAGTAGYCGKLMTDDGNASTVPASRRIAFHLR